MKAMNVWTSTMVRTAPLFAISVLMTACMSKAPLATTNNTTALPAATPLVDATAASNTVALAQDAALTGVPLDANGKPITAGFQVDANGHLVLDANGKPIPLNAAAPTTLELLAKRLFNFDYDSSIISKDNLPALAAHANYLATHAAAKLRVLGNTDERGTPEYNMALGERRAQSVQDFLVISGAKATQIETISYGKEKPINDGHDEAAWAENRRVELKYDAVDPSK